MKKRIMALLLSATMVTTVLGNISFVSHATNNEELAVVTASTDDASSKDDYSNKVNDPASDASEDSDIIDDKNLDESSGSNDDFSLKEESKEKTEYDNSISEKDSDDQGDDESVSVKESDDESEVGDEETAESSHSDKKDSDEVAVDDESGIDKQEESDKDDTVNGNADSLPSDLDNEDTSTEGEYTSNGETQVDETESGLDVVDDISDGTENEADNKENEDQLKDDELGKKDDEALSEETDPADDMLNADDELDPEKKDQLSEEDKTKKFKEKTEDVTEIKTAVDGMTIIVSGEDLTDITVSAKTVELEGDILVSYYENAEIIKAVDITLFDAEKKEWQPEENGQTVSIEIRGIDLPETDVPVSVVRIDDSVIENTSEANGETVQVVSEDAATGEDSVEFEAEHFTVYAMVLTGNNSKIAKSGTCGDNITWSISAEYDGYTLTVSGSGDMYDYENESDVPWDPYVNGKHINNIVINGNITSISNWFFSYCDCSKVDIPNSVVSIGDYAFYESEISEITLPDSLETIGDGAFELCLLKEVEIPGSVTSIGDYAFSNNKIAAITFHDSLKTIGDCSFAGSLITEVEIPGSVTSIGEGAFSGCYELQRVQLSEGLSKMGNYCFQGSEKLLSIHIPASVTQIGYGIVIGAESLKSLSVATGNQKYDSRNNCNAVILTSDNILVTGCPYSYIPEGITRIEDYAFGLFRFMVPLSFPSSLTAIGRYAFSDCPISDLVLNEGLTTLEQGAFFGCDIETIQFPESLTSIGQGAFAYNRLVNLVLPETISCVEERAFGSNRSLISVTIPYGISTIKEKAFDDCPILTEVTISESVILIEGGSFDYVTDVYYTGSESEWNLIVGKEYIPQSATIHYGNNDDKLLQISSLELTYKSNSYDILTKRFVLYQDDGKFDLCCSASYAGLSENLRYDLYSGSSLVATSYDGVFSDLQTSQFMPEYSISIEVSHKKVQIQKDTLLRIVDPVRVDNVGCLFHSAENGGGVGTISFYIDEQDFLKTSNVYNHSIAKYACGLSTMAYSEVADSIAVCFSELAYDSGDKDQYYYRDEEGNTATFWIAKKPLHEDTTLVTVLIRGTDGKEWFDNFEPGTGERHEGFERGCNEVSKALFDYLNNCDLDYEKTKILITGHSRGAAVANLLGHDISHYGLCGANIGQKNIFVYTFATPNVSKDSFNSKENNSNIFNIVNPEDFVTKVLPSAWGYGRYGKTYVLPSSIDCSNDYYGYLYDVQSKWEKYWGSKSKLYRPYEDGMQTVSDYVYSLTIKVPGIKEYYSKPLLPWTPYFSPTLYSLFINALATYMAGDFWSGLDSFAQASTGSYGEVGVNTATFFICNEAFSNYFLYGHASETYLAAMNAVTEEELKRPKTMLHGIINCPVDATIVDSNGNVVGEIKDNKITKETEGISLSVEGNSKVFYISGNADYQIKLTGNDKGTMDYSLNEVDCDTLAGSRIYYHDVPLEKGTTYIDTIDADSSFDSYQLVDTSGNNVNKTIISEENTGSLSTIVTIEGTGEADSFYNLTPGDYVQMEATPTEGNHFVGWYKDGNLVSTDSVYGFSIANDENFVAKFAADATIDNGNDDNNNSVNNENNNTNNSSNNENAGTTNNNSATNQNNSATDNSKNNGKTESNNKPAVQDNSSSKPASNTTPQNTSPATDTSSKQGTGSSESANGTSAKAKNTATAKTKVKLNYTKLTLGKGGKFTLTAKVTGAKKKTTIKWSSSDKKVATVNKKGEITAKAKGKCTITAKTSDGKVKATCTLTIKKDPIKVKKATVNKKSISLKKGKTFALKAGFTPYNATISSITYSTSDKKIATVSKTGVIKAKKKGKCTITVKIKDKAKKTKTVKCTVTVK